MRNFTITIVSLSGLFFLGWMGCSGDNAMNPQYDQSFFTLRFCIGGVKEAGHP